MKKRIRPARNDPLRRHEIGQRVLHGGALATGRVKSPRNIAPSFARIDIRERDREPPQPNRLWLSGTSRRKMGHGIDRTALCGNRPGRRHYRTSRPLGGHESTPLDRHLAVERLISACKIATQTRGGRPESAFNSKNGSFPAPIDVSGTWFARDEGSDEPCEYPIRCRHSRRGPSRSFWSGLP